MSKYEIGNIVKGKISGIEEYGAFVTVDNYYSGLIHISEISDGFVKDVHDYFKIGDVIDVKIIDVDQENSHLKLSIKTINSRKNKKNIRHKIYETSKGFSTLNYKLPIWIEENLKKIKNV